MFSRCWIKEPSLPANSKNILQAEIRNHPKTHTFLSPTRVIDNPYRTANNRNAIAGTYILGLYASGERKNWYNKTQNIQPEKIKRTSSIISLLFVFILFVVFHVFMLHIFYLWAAVIVFAVRRRLSF